MRVTMSGLARAEACPVSTRLPQVHRIGTAAAAGSAVHLFLWRAAEVGRERALELTSEEYRARCEAIYLEKLPHGTRDAWSYEVGFAYDIVTDGAEMFASTGRDYSAHAGKLCGTADVVGIVGSEVAVLDVKTGWADLGKPAENLQLLAYAVAAARVSGASSATVGCIYLRDETPHYDVAQLDSIALDAAAARIAQVVEAVAVVASDAEPNEGTHCKYCPAFTSCPAKIGLMREGAGEWVLDATTAPKALARLEAVEEAAARMRAALVEYAEVTSIVVGDRTFGLKLTTRESVDVAVAKEVLSRVGGLAAIEESTSKAAIGRALGFTGKKLAAIIDELRTAGAIRARTTRSVGWLK